MTFEARLAQDAAVVDRRLALLLEELAGGKRGRPVPADLLAAMRHGLLGGGKRFRPFLVLETAALYGIAPEQAAPAAAAIECVHAYSLVHDDLPSMDDDTLRRGLPTVHVKFGEATAILAGDALLTLAFDIVADPACHPDAAVRIALVATLARAAGASGMVGGQILDLAAERQPVGLAATERLQAMKTGALIAWSVEAGARLGGGSAEEQRALATYAQALGLGFQISDDLLDAEGDVASVGKTTGKDEAAGKATFVSLLGIDGARSRLAALEAEAVSALAPFGPRAATLVEAAHYLVRRRS